MFVAGLAALVQGGNFLVDGAASLAERYKISHLVIGLTIVAFGTSAPELVVSLLASIENHGAISLGNVLGSNVTNTFVALGLAAVICPIAVRKNTVWKEIPLNLLMTLVVGLMANDILIDNADASAITRIDGLILICFFFIFMYYTFTIAKQSGDGGLDEPIKVFSIPKSVIYLILGLIALVIGAEWTVSGSTVIAKDLGFSESFIALTVIAVGTSLPEIVTSTVAAYKQNSDMAVGNVVGSNVFNLLWVLGLSSTVNPLAVDHLTNSSIFFALASVVLLFLFLFFNKKKILSRTEGVIFLLIYAAYTTYLVMAQ